MIIWSVFDKSLSLKLPGMCGRTGENKCIIKHSLCFAIESLYEKHLDL
jgi:hypothetical protein